MPKPNKQKSNMLQNYKPMKNNGIDIKSNNKKPTKKQGKGPLIFFSVSVVLLLISIVFDNERGLKSLFFLLNLLKSMIPVLAFVFVLMVLINIFLKSETLIKYMGKDSGLKGWFVAVVTGILSVGAIYMWFPLLKDMLDKGVKQGLVAVFLYNRGIKLQWLPVLAFYFSLKYVIVLTLVMILASLVQGIIINRIFEKK